MEIATVWGDHPALAMTKKEDRHELGSSEIMLETARTPSLRKDKLMGNLEGLQVEKWHKGRSPWAGKDHPALAMTKKR